jgi:hypothetical protein
MIVNKIVAPILNDALHSALNVGRKVSSEVWSARIRLQESNSSFELGLWPE